MARPPTGKRAQVSNALKEEKIGFTTGQLDAVTRFIAENPGTSRRQAVRSIFNAGAKQLGLYTPTAAPAVAGSIGVAPPLRNAA